jgi:hypothetical protein
MLTAIKEFTSKPMHQGFEVNSLMAVKVRVRKLKNKVAKCLNKER